MTTVIACRDEEECYLLSDGRVTSGIVSMRMLASPKYIEFKGEDTFYLGVSGLFKGLSLIKHNVNELERECKFNLGHISFHLFPKILELFEEHGLKHDDCSFLFVGEKGVYHATSLENSLMDVDGEFFVRGVAQLLH